MIAPTDITGVDVSTARRILAYARSIASCLDSLDGESRADAIAILQGVAQEVAARGSRLIAAQRVGTASVNYREVASSFSDDDRSALRTLCSAGSIPSGMPVGSFPRSNPFRRIWPEEPYT